MKTKKTLTIEIEISDLEIQEIVIKHLAETNEEFKKIYDSESKPIITELEKTNGFAGYKLEISKTK